MKLAVLAICLGLGGLVVGITAAASGSPAPSARVQVDSVSCAASGAPGHAVHGSCTFQLTDGRRFRCPVSFANRRQTPDSLRDAKACRALAPIRIPPAWRRVFSRLYAVQACLARQGLRSRGGPAFNQLRAAPIGELEFVTGARMAFVAFYASAQRAQQAEPRVRANFRRLGGQVFRRGAVTVGWTKPPSAHLRAVTHACGLP